MSAVCPTCGVAVVPGYVKCPKCHAKLPSFGGRARVVEGGTAVPQRGFPVAAVAVPLALAAVIIVYFGFVRGPGGNRAKAATTDVTPVPTVVAASATTPADPGTTAAAAPPAAPSLASVTGDLQRELQRQRLWGTIETAGSRVDVRSTSCGEAAMGSIVDDLRAVLRSAGATQVRCLAQSGSVVFQRDL